MIHRIYTVYQIRLIICLIIPYTCMSYSFITLPNLFICSWHRVDQRLIPENQWWSPITYWSAMIPLEWSLTLLGDSVSLKVIPFFSLCWEVWEPHHISALWWHRLQGSDPFFIDRSVQKALIIGSIILKHTFYYLKSCLFSWIRLLLI